MDLRVKIQPKEIFIYSMYNFWAGLRGIGCIILLQRQPARNVWERR
jgi:hypothetical protein